LPKILIVDDEVSIRETLSEFMREEGYRISTAEDADTALACIRHDEPDVVVTDIILPRVTGVSLLREIHNLAPDAQVIMITGEPTAETAAEAVRLGAFDYLSKPIARDDFKSSVASAARVAELARRKRQLEEENLRYQEQLEDEVAKKTAELRTSEERFRKLFELSPYSMVYLDLDGRILLCNNRFTELHATREGPHAQIGRSILEFVCEEDRDRLPSVIERMIAGNGARAGFEATMLREVGEPFPAEAVGTLIRDEDGQAHAILALAIDITERKRAERAERDRQEKIQRSNEALLGLATRRDVYEGNLKPAFRAITETAADVLDVAQVGIWLLDEDRTMTRGVNMYYASEDIHRRSRDFLTADLSAYLAALETHRVLTVTDVYNDPRTAEFDLDALRSEGIVSTMNASIRVGGQSIGDVSFEHAGELREWTHEDEEFASSIASLVALTVESSQRLRVEEALRASEEKHRAVVEHANDAIFVIDEQRIAFANPEAVRIVQLSESALLGRSFLDFVDSRDHELVITSYGRVLNGSMRRTETRIRVLGSDGAVRWLAVRGVGIEWEDHNAVLCFANDITDQIEAEREKNERQERIQRGNEALLQLAVQRVLYEGNLDPAFRLIAETAADVLDVAQVAIWLLDESEGVFRCADLYVRSEGIHKPGRDYDQSDLPVYFDVLEKNRVLNVPYLQSDPRMAEFDLQSMANEGIVSVLDAAVRSGGRLIGDVCFEQTGDLRQWTHEDEEFAGEIASLVALTVESSQRRQAETALERREREYQTLFENSPVSLWYEDFSEVRSFLDDLQSSGVTDLRTHLHDHPETLDQCVAKIRVVDINETTVTMHEAESKDELMQGFRQLLTSASRASIADQLVAIWNGERFFEDTRVDRTVKGNERQVAVRWVVPPGYEETLERVLLAKTDISAVIEAEQALRKALDGTIEAIGLTTETRDPYTAGHQRRVTRLAKEIAVAIGLDEKAVEGIWAAGLLHDIGKMAIPAEILSKPSRLTEMEMALIQSHPQVAYDILKSISFPWPLAEIVLQHHERLDGSGYPQGLRGNEILIEARILAVADTVEAMASHRPYRAAVGVDAALEEIEVGRGVRYDTEVVDACLKLFREKRFRFQDS